MTYYLTLNDLSYDKQFVFRKYHLTESPALNIVDFIINHLDNRNTPLLSTSCLTL